MQLMPLYDVLGEADAGALLGSEPQSRQSAKGLFAAILDRTSELSRKGEQAVSAASPQARSAFGGWVAGDGRADAGKAADESAAKVLEAAMAKVTGKESESGRSRHDLKVTTKDFKAIKKVLKEFGISDEDIDALEEKVSSEGGLTWGRLVSAVSSKAAELSKTASSRELTVDEESAILSMFQKMGFTPQGAESLLSEFKSGHTDLAWAEVQEKLDAMAEDKTLELSDNELDALVAVMGLGTGDAERLKSLLGGAERVQVTKAKLESVLAAARQSAGDDANERLQNVVELRDAIKAVFTEAKEKADSEERSKRGPDDAARRSRILAEHARREEKAEKGAPKPGENVALAEEAEEGGTEAAKVLRNEPAKTTAAAARAAAAQAGDGEASDASDAADAKGEAATKAAQAKADAKNVAGDAKADADKGVATGSQRRVEANRQAGTDAQETGDSKSDAKDAKADANSKAWDSFWSKVRREDTDVSGKTRSEVGTDASAAKAANTARPETTVPFPTTDAASTAEAAADKIMQRVTEGNPERVLRQVEQGVLKNVGQGTKQLTLRLTPPDLGRVHLQIQAKEGEVRVLLRAENSDAGRMISENLAHVRQSLESQGLKVDKLEVQTQLADNQFKDGAWQGAQEHNEMLQRHRDMARLSRWRSMRSQDMGVAREMQNVHEQARISSQGIDIIA